MAVGDVKLKKLFQGPLSTAVVAKYTCPAGKQAHINEIWIDNQNTTTIRKVSLYAHGTAAANRLAGKIAIQPESGQVISDTKIILNENEIFGLSQDVGTDVICTIYGYEEELV